VERRIRTSRERFTAVLGEQASARILVEAATESEWVAQHLAALGHEVIVADPNFAPMYATRSRRVKTDRRGSNGARRNSQTMSQFSMRDVSYRGPRRISIPTVLRDRNTGVPLYVAHRMRSSAGT